MSSPSINNISSKQVCSRLFGDERTRFDAWLAQTQDRLAANSPTLAPSFIPLPSAVNTSGDSASLTQLCTRVAQSGFAFYEWQDQATDVAGALNQLLQSLHLRGGDTGVIRDSHGLSLLQDLSGTAKGRFPPYQSKHMNWHTDGYYNDESETVRCFTLHCVEPAAKGGAIVLMDDAFLIYALIQEDPELVALLSHPQAMTLPHNTDKEGHDRPDRTLPMIMANADNTISMRFTTRSQNISWRNNETYAAAQRAAQLILEHPDRHTRVRLEKGQGVITRNILHAREQFLDTPENPKRQMLRGRFNNLPRITAHKKLTHSPADDTHATP